MYAIVDPKSFWSQMPTMSTLPANQIYMTPVPATPTYLIGGTPQMMPLLPHSHQMPGMVYGVHPGWYSQPPCVPSANHSISSSAFFPPSSRPRVSSDDVFLADAIPSSSSSSSSSSPSSSCHAMCIPCPDNHNLKRRRRQRALGGTDDLMSLESNSPKETSRERRHSGTASSDSSVHSSPQSDADTASSSSRSSSSTRSSSPCHDERNDRNEDSSGLQHPSLKGETTDVNLDNTLYNIFTTSLYSALTRDPPEPSGQRVCNKSDILPLKTSSPIAKEKRPNNTNTMTVPCKTSDLQNINLNQLQSEAGSSRGHFDFDPMEQLDGQGGGKRREKFLRALEEERERQRCLTLPKHAPKMNCKFCKNNGESAEIYTKHRLHFKEKTACPLLRLYVCRLCNSTGDFAHTIRHCPFNSRFDRVAWKATFL